MSNKKAQSSKEAAEERSKVKQQINELGAAIQDTKCRTLGEYFYLHVNPHEERIRRRFTHRDMYRDEFNAIWLRQSEEHPDLLTNEFREQLEYAIFYQRPLKDQKDKVGKCELEQGEYRAPVALVEVQRLRMLLTVNNLRLFEPTGKERKLTRHERETIMAMGESGETLKLDAVKKKIGVKMNCRFTMENGGETKMPANATASRLRKILKQRWDQMSGQQQTQLVDLLVDASGTIEDLQSQLEADFSLPHDLATKVAEQPLPQGYYSISRKAVLKLLPLLQEDDPLSFTEAKEKAYGKPAFPKPLDLLPPVETALPEIRNPIVMRSLTELRKTVNAIIREYGKPDAVRVELARDVKRGHEERMKLQKRMRGREGDRSRAKQDLAPYFNLAPGDVRPRDIEKWLLWEECGRHCPYSGRPISMEALFGPTPSFQIEHIIPLSRSLDDSFNNKTLCSNALNARKGNRTPWEAFGPDDDWEMMVERVRAFNNPYKFSRFILTEADQEALLEEFTTRQLNDTRYASRLAARYLGLLFGGIDDEEGTKRVFTCAGQVTALLRREWQLNGILNERSNLKSRDDHRHHAVDAAAVAMSSPRTIKALSDAAQRAGSENRLRFGKYLDLPWESFRDDLAGSVAGINVSLRPQYKLLSQMHDETLYTKARADAEGKQYVCVRKPFTAPGFKSSDILDPGIRAIVEAKIAEVGGTARLESDPPRDAGGRPIKKVRVRINVNTEPTAISTGTRERHVMPNSIHHTEILRDESVKGKVRYRFATVSTIEAMRRHRAKEPIVQKDHGEKVAFVCTLRPGDVISAKRSIDQNDELWRVRTIRAAGSLAVHLLQDSRQKGDIQAAGGIWQPSVNALFAAGARKVKVGYLGEVTTAND